MAKFVLPLLTLVLAVSARADVSDSGNLTIGGQGVIQGTMTVQGSAFSVGGATFSVAGGSITMGGRLNAAAAGIKWADGTTSTTSSSGAGAGNAVLSATQAWSGANAFTSQLAMQAGSTLSAGPSISVAGTTNTILDYVHPSGLELVVGSISPAAAVSSWTIAGFSKMSSSAVFHVDVVFCSPSVAADMSMRINADAGATNYVSAIIPGANVGNVSSDCTLTRQVSDRAVALTECGMARFTLARALGPSAQNKVYAVGMAMNYGDASQSSIDSSPFVCRYSGASPFDSITFFASNPTSATFYINAKVSLVGN